MVYYASCPQFPLVAELRFQQWCLDMYCGGATLALRKLFFCFQCASVAEPFAALLMGPVSGTESRVLFKPGHSPKDGGFGASYYEPQGPDLPCVGTYRSSGWSPSALCWHPFIMGIFWLLLTPQMLTCAFNYLPDSSTTSVFFLLWALSIISAWCCLLVLPPRLRWS